MNNATSSNQLYEKYWALTLEYSDIYGEQFNNVLFEIVNFIDSQPNKNREMAPEDYKRLQRNIELMYPKSDSASTRKSINQMLKLGFINNHAIGYHKYTKKFLNENNADQKRTLFSKIVYENSSFSRSMTNYSNYNNMSFLIKTIEECNEINKDELLAIMFSNIEDYPVGYLTKSELKNKTTEIKNINAVNRKYNQLKYLFKLCGLLTGIYTSKNIISLSNNIQMDSSEKKYSGRDPYLQRLYKNELINEEKNAYQIDAQQCVLEKISYPILIASHIKPYRECSEEEKFDKNNGLLLSKNMDSLFDGGYITFDESGKIIPSTTLKSDVKNHLNNYRLDQVIFNKERKKYMDYHRKYIFLDSLK